MKKLRIPFIRRKDNVNDRMDIALIAYDLPPTSLNMQALLIAGADTEREILETKADRSP
jgi:hypothetical protein